MEAGTLSGRYETGERLGSGGMSNVYKATDRILERTVAVKILAEHLSDDERFVARFRREALEALDLGELSAHGYAFQIETTFRLHRLGLRIVEVPITFVERRAGSSKMTGSIVAEAMWRVPLLRLRSLTGRL